MSTIAPRIAFAALLMTGVAVSGCGSSEREDKARYEERQQLRHDGQSGANHAADQGRSDLDRATQGK